MTTRNQHYVWQYYLKGWGKGNDQVSCLRHAKVFSTNTKNIMVERDFYRLVPFTQEDIQFFELWLHQQSSPAMRAYHRKTFRVFKKVANQSRIIQESDTFTADEKIVAQNVAVELEESLHSGTEEIAIPLIKELRQERLDFLEDETSVSYFYHFIGHQYFRTQQQREQVRQILASLGRGYDFSNLYHLFCYCYGENFGGSLFRSRNRLGIIFLRDQNDSLIAGDQPIVNLAYSGNMEHDDVVLYYPLGPSLAILITFLQFPSKSLEISDAVSTRLNETIAFQSNQFLVGNSEQLLRQYCVKPPKHPDVMSLLL